MTDREAVPMKSGQRIGERVFYLARGLPVVNTKLGIEANSPVDVVGPVCDCGQEGPIWNPPGTNRQKEAQRTLVKRFSRSAAEDANGRA